MVLTSAYSVVEGAVEDVAALEAGNHFAAEHYFAEAALAVVYSAGDYVAAFEFWEKAAGLGDIDSTFQLSSGILSGAWC